MAIRSGSTFTSADFAVATPSARRTFVEQLPTFAARLARRSVPLQRDLEDVGLHHGGRPGQRFAERSKIAVNRMTLLRLVRRLPEPPVTTPKVLGIDDFALKRAHRYGTICVDLEQRRIVDLLPERTASAVATWIADHGRPEFVCRDRGGAFAEGGREGAPDAVQVADRFHLLVRRFIRSAIPIADGKGSEGGLWVNGLPRGESQRGQQHAA